MKERFTVAEVAQRLGVGREMARGLVAFIVAVGGAECMGERKHATSRGGLEKVYQFADGFENEIATRLRDANLTAT